MMFSGRSSCVVASAGWVGRYLYEVSAMTGVETEQMSERNLRKANSYPEMERSFAS